MGSLFVLTKGSMSFFPLLIVSLLSGVICQHASGNLRGSTLSGATALPNTTGFINVSNSVNESLRIAKSCTDAYTLAPGGNARIELAHTGVRFWVVPSSIEWDCHPPCPQCFYFDTGAVNASRTQVTVGYGLAWTRLSIPQRLQSRIPQACKLSCQTIRI